MKFYFKEIITLSHSDCQLQTPENSLLTLFRPFSLKYFGRMKSSTLEGPEKLTSYTQR